MICNGLASRWHKLLNSSKRGTNLRRIRNAGVVGSNPIGGTTTFSSKFERFLAKVRKTKGPPTYYFVRDSEPTDRR